MSNTQYIVETTHIEVEKTRAARESGDTERTTEIKKYEFETLIGALSHVKTLENARYFHFSHKLFVGGLEIPKEIVDELLHCMRLRQKLEKHKQQIHANIDKLDIFNLLKFTNLK